MFVQQCTGQSSSNIHDAGNPTPDTARTFAFMELLETMRDAIAPTTDTEHDTDMSLFDPTADEPPTPDELPFDDPTHTYGSSYWEHLVDTITEAAELVETNGKASTNDISRISSLPRGAPSRGWDVESWYFLKVAPTLSTHEAIEWRGCYTFDPETALPKPELKDWARERWDLPEEANRSRGGVVTNVRYYYAKVLEVWYRNLRDRHESGDIPGASEFDLEEWNLGLKDYHHSNCLEYFHEIPGVCLPEYEGWDEARDEEADKYNAPVWYWMGDE